MSSTNITSPLILNSSARSHPTKEQNLSSLEIAAQCRLQQCASPPMGKIEHAAYQSNRLPVITRGPYPLLARVPIRWLRLFGVLALGSF
jgi:hypothetical protein